MELLANPWKDAINGTLSELVVSQLYLFYKIFLCSMAVNEIDQLWKGLSAMLEIFFFSYKYPKIYRCTQNSW